MSKTGRYFVYDLGSKRLKQVVEPISKHPCRNADWDNGIDYKNLPECGSIQEKDSIITEENGFKDISYK